MRKKKEKKENSERWLLTYSDLITLLMILFILLYAMSAVSEVKYEQLANSLSGSLGSGSSIFQGTEGVLDSGSSVLGGGALATDTVTQTIENTTENTTEDTTEDTTENTTEDTGSNNSIQTGDTATGITEQADMEKLKTHIDNILSKYNADGDIGSYLGESGLVITFSDNVFFDSGEDTLKDKMKSSLDQITVLLNKIDNLILIEGNADNVPVKNSKFSSNWQLSTIRAANVVQYLVEVGHINGTRLSAIGYGEYRPVASNDTEKGRSKNRRIDITILYNSQEGVQPKK